MINDYYAMICKAIERVENELPEHFQITINLEVGFSDVELFMRGIPVELESNDELLSTQINNALDLAISIAKSDY